MSGAWHGKEMAGEKLLTNTAMRQCCALSRGGQLVGAMNVAYLGMLSKAAGNRC